ncbi:unnamed protein product, partial [Urochloa humidicola]
PASYAPVPPLHSFPSLLSPASSILSVARTPPPTASSPPPNPIEARVLPAATVATHLSFLFSSSTSATTRLFVDDHQDNTARGRHSGLAEVRGAGEGVRRPSRRAYGSGTGRPRPGPGRRPAWAAVPYLTMAVSRLRRQTTASASFPHLLTRSRPRRPPCTPRQACLTSSSPAFSFPKGPKPAAPTRFLPLAPSSCFRRFHIGKESAREVRNQCTWRGTDRSRGDTSTHRHLRT